MAPEVSRLQHKVGRYLLFGQIGAGGMAAHLGRRVGALDGNEVVLVMEYVHGRSLSSLSSLASSERENGRRVPPASSSTDGPGAWRADAGSGAPIPRQPEPKAPADRK